MASAGGKEGGVQSRFPPDQTFFGNLKSTFKDIAVGNDSEQKIPTMPFCDAAESYVKVFELVNSFSTNQVLSDMNGNIAKLRNVYLAHPLESESLQDLALAEQKRGVSAKKAEGNLGLFWLVRALEMNAQSIVHALENPQLKLSDAFVETYDRTLAPWQGTSTQWITKKGLRLAPNRQDFLPLLGDSPDRVKADAQQWIEHLKKAIEILDPFIIKVVAPFIGQKKS